MTQIERSNNRSRITEVAEELIERAPCGYVSAAADGTILLANKKIATMVGRRADELAGQVRLQKLMTTGSQIYFETHVNPLLLMQGHVEEIAVEMRGPNGPVPVLLNAELQRDHRGQVIGILASILDATERRRYERELLAERNNAEEAARQKSELISMISHDIRTPLAALSTVGELLESTALDESQAQYVQILKSSSRNLLQLVNDVLDVGKIEAGCMRLDKKPVNLRQLIEGLVQEARVEADRKGLIFELDIDPRMPPSLRADAIKIGRILSNLMGNAVKFTDKGVVGILAHLVHADGNKASVRFEIWDTGIGISRDQLERIFDDFTQGSDEIGSRYGGSGLGLGICQKFLNLHGAALTVESEPGEGARFCFELALDQDGPALVVSS